MNEGYRAWGAMKSVLSNKGLGISVKKLLHKGEIVKVNVLEESVTNG